VKQVLINIINNAIKFSPDRSIITIRATKEEQDVLFEIEDTGRGIPKEKQNKIFDTFYQVDGGMDRKFGGAGLGLAIARGIVLSHGGDIWVESSGTPGEGTTFKFTLPLIPVHDLEGKFREVDIFRLKDTKKSIENDLRSKTVI
jgi:signal transduction histidine kinase